MPHANARLNIHGRQLLVDRILIAGRKPAHVAAELGVSRQCAYRWLRRYVAEGPAGLVDRSSRPHRCPTRTAAEVESAVVALRRSSRRGQQFIADGLGVPARTVSAILRRHRLPYLRQCDPLTGQVIRASKVTAVRYERDRPGELIHMDVKKIGRIPQGGGWKAHGRRMSRTYAAKKARTGYDYVHSAIDDHSRLAYSEILPDEKGATCAAFLTRAAAYFNAAGISHIERVMTDNAFAYRYSTAIRTVINNLGARQVFIRPHCPWQNGKAERFNRTLATEWAYYHVFTTNDARCAALAPWLEHYNNQRRHSAIGGQPPVSRLSPT
ncbi:transposase [Mycobacterium mantenii]|uniref:IS481 family transposase n=1 Tax=Mycobacterium mantenii TaxID=560555 RepID=UPI0007FBBE35|nr:IS481 family transposase [Mycobacterium mantenii]OBH57110.1 transposase [Mycobacterium mantenii]OBH79783.1 transposase [Mycobacterium mantenii]